MNPAWSLGFMWYFISWAVLAEGKQELILIILLNIRLMIIINQYRHLHNSPVKKKIKEISECQNVWFPRFDWINWQPEHSMDPPHHHHHHYYTHTTINATTSHFLIYSPSISSQRWQCWRRMVTNGCCVLAAGLQFLTAKNPPFFCFDRLEKKNLVKWLPCRHAKFCFTPCTCNSWPSSEQSLQHGDIWMPTC